MVEIAEIPMSELEPPERDEHLHPEEKDSGEEFEEIVDSINQEGQDEPIKVKENGEGYEIIDGTRRYRALRESELESALCMVREDIETEADRLILMVRSNEFSKNSDPEARARVIAKLIAPHLLPESERIENEPKLTQSEMADRVGKSQPTISNWLSPVRDKYPLRDKLSDIIKSRNPGPEEIEVIDGIVGNLRHGQSPVVSRNEIDLLISELSHLNPSSVDDIAISAKMANQEDWDVDDYIDHLYDVIETTTDNGGEMEVVRADGKEIEDTSPETNHDSDETERIRDDIEPFKNAESGSGDSIVDQPDKESPPEQENPFDVDWKDVISEDVLNTYNSAEHVMEDDAVAVKMTFEGDEAVALSYLADSKNISREQLIREIIDGDLIENATPR